MTKHSYDKEFKEQAVQYYLDNKDHMAMNEISKNLGIGASTLHKWIKLFTETGEFGRGSGNFASDKDKEIARLKRQLRDAEGAIEVLKKINRDSEQVTTEKVYREMDVQHASESHPSINGMCNYVGISRSGYYQREIRRNHQLSMAVLKCMKMAIRTIPLRVDTLNNKSVNPRGCFAL